MRLYNKTFKIETLRRRRRRELGRISNFKWLEAPLNLDEIKNPFGFVQSNPEADACWVPLFIFLKRCFFEISKCKYFSNDVPAHATLTSTFQASRKDLPKPIMCYIFEVVLQYTTIYVVNACLANMPLCLLSKN